MASLAVQPTIYAAAWLPMGLSFRLKRRVAVLRAAGWFAGACCTVLVYLSSAFLPFNVELAINVLLACCFLPLQQGVDAFAESPSPRWEFVGVLCGMWLVELLRRLGNDGMKSIPATNEVVIATVTPC